MQTNQLHYRTRIVVTAGGLRSTKASVQREQTNDRVLVRPDAAASGGLIVVGKRSLLKSDPKALSGWQQPKSG